MDKLRYFIIILLFCCTIVKAQNSNTWTRIADFGGIHRYSSIAFSIDSFGYVGLGYYQQDTAPYHYYYLADFWQYNPYTNIWTQKANFPGVAREGAICFTIGSKGYVGLGDDPTNLNDLWEYDATTDVWSQKGNFSGGYRTGAIAFSIANKGYVGLGVSDTSQSLFIKQDFWEYDPISDTWTQKGDFAGGNRGNAIGCSTGGYGYVGFGDSQNNIDYYKNDFWQYNPTTDSWTQKANFIGKAREAAFVFCIGDSVYVGTGVDSAGQYLKDFWLYTPLTDTWIQKDSFSGVNRLGAASFSIGNKGYAGTGAQSTTAQYYSDFWMYTPDSIATGICGIDANSISIYPDPATDRLYVGGLSQTSTLTITDMTGRMCATQIGSEIDISTLPSGVYCLRIQDSGGNSVVKKFTKL